MEKIKVLVIDDSTFIRQSISLLFNDDPTIKIIGEASNPFEALEKIQHLEPDVLLLDIEMPKMDGLTFLKNIMIQKPMPIIMFSAYIEEGSENALKAFQYGAVDIIEKPKLNAATELNKYKDRLTSALKAAKIANISNITRINKKPPDSQATQLDNIINNSETPSFIVAIGASTGGTEAIRWLLQAVPENFPPIVIAQHMPVGFTHSFAKRMNNLSKITVKEAEEGETLKNGHAYIAKGDRHLVLKKVDDTHQLVLDDSELVNGHKPAVDVLFESVAENFKKNALGVILTGMGSDGSKGLKKIKEEGGQTIAQDENTSVVFGMPKAAILMGVVDSVLPIYKIVESLLKIIEKALSNKS